MTDDDIHTMIYTIIMTVSGKTDMEFDREIDSATEAVMSIFKQWKEAQDGREKTP